MTPLLMPPPQTETTRQWAARVAAALPDLAVVVAEDEAHAAREIGRAEAAFGTLTPALLAKAQRLRWLQAPQAAPPAGFYYADLIAHPVVITNFREIYNDHIGAHIMAFVLAFAPRAAPPPATAAAARVEAGAAGHWRRPPARGHPADRGRRRHRQRGRA